jgi:SNF2 family DNA or RNA helicase
LVAALSPHLPEVAQALKPMAWRPEPAPQPVHHTLSAAKDVASAGAGKDLVEDVTNRLKAVLPEGKVPFAYQNVGIAFAEATNGNCLIADEMGLGKTWQALGYLALHPEFKALVICPSSLTLNWAREAAGLVPNRRVSLVLSGASALPKTPDLVIISYDLAVRRRAELESAGFQVVIIDESHKLKSEDAKRTKEILGYDRKVVAPSPAAEVR